MRIIRSVKEMHACADEIRQSGKRIGLVPTMGFLHEGHISLIRLIREQADYVIVSIFVNPTQFGEGEDFDSYPRDFECDRQMVAAAGADCIYTPEVDEMYPDGSQTAVSVSQITRNLCGRSRPSHFEGVATVVAKLFNAVKPHAAVFGEKDFQQLMVIKRMVLDLNMDIEILGAPIVREADGLAMSSRNTYLTPEQRAAALGLSRGLSEVRDMVASGERSAAKLISHVQKMVEATGLGKVDYIKVCDLATLEDVEVLERDAVMALAVQFGKARLIDNCVLEM